MRYTTMLTATVVATLLACAGTAAAATPTASATLLARSTLVGVQAAMREARAGNKVGVDAATCVQALQPAALVPVFETAVKDNWSAADVDAIEAFLATPAGRKYTERSVVQARLDAGEPLTAPMPEYTEDELAALNGFRKTPAGAQLVSRGEFANERSRKAIQARLLELLTGCRAVP
ncbi:MULTISPECIES: hypothetical protein [unclassified Rhizobacter]|uniref:hypothetical protein n=1 Tax=unclassified Rhizobacter TaxID=2640088 RepID=UPI00070EAB8D|nr:MULTISPECIES: hypothetical protein [unclassified Rhizobacter]KQU67167.1 hypothetical protein ASC88_09150 [Rhizobacter sp. Root29]